MVDKWGKITREKKTETKCILNRKLKKRTTERKIDYSKA